jgi:FkbM family methyltransferase
MPEVMISYAQNFEDVLLARVFRGRATGFYIDIGAMDPVADSVTKYFYDLGWHGINVEPVPEFSQALTDQRPRDINVCAAIAEHQGQATLYYLPGTGLSSLEPAALDEAARLGRQTDLVKVPTLTLAELCERHVQEPIDFLKVDVEGGEHAVLRGGDWERFRPTVVVVEAVKPNTQIPTHDEWEACLTANGYDFAVFDGLNRFYIAREASHVGDALRLAPNYFDNFVLWRTVRAESELARVHQELEQKVHELGEVDAARLMALESVEVAGHTNNELLMRLTAVHQELERKVEELQQVDAARRAAVAALSGKRRSRGDQHQDEAHQAALNAAAAANAQLRARLEALHDELEERSRAYTVLWNERNYLAEQLAALVRSENTGRPAGFPASG